MNAQPANQESGQSSPNNIVDLIAGQLGQLGITSYKDLREQVRNYFPIATEEEFLIGVTNLTNLGFIKTSTQPIDGSASYITFYSPQKELSAYVYRLGKEIQGEDITLH